MLMRSLAEVSKKGHWSCWDSKTPSPFDTSLLSSMSDCVCVCGGREGRGDSERGGRELWRSNERGDGRKGEINKQRKKERVKGKGESMGERLQYLICLLCLCLLYLIVFTYM